MLFFFSASEKVEEVKVLEKKIKHIEKKTEPEPEAVDLKPIPGLKFVKNLKDISVDVSAV